MWLLCDYYFVSDSADLSTSMKMMEKMGWKEGEGLGRDNQGVSEPIQLKMNMMNRGERFVS